MYNLICDVLRLAPFAIILYLLWFVNFRNKLLKYFVILLVGHVVINVFVHLYWSYAFFYAPTPALQEEVGLKDGASRAFALFIGWLYALVFALIANGAKYLATKMFSLIKTMRSSFSPKA